LLEALTPGEQSKSGGIEEMARAGLQIASGTASIVGEMISKSRRGDAVRRSSTRMSRMHQGLVDDSVSSERSARL
jgi:hypothetical protein